MKPKALALTYLARREHSYQELAQKLRLAGIEVDLIDSTLRALVAEGYLSDSRYAEAYIRTQALKGYGPRRIIPILYQKGLSTAVVETAMIAVQDEIDWQAIKQRVKIKKFGSLPARDRQTQYKQRQFLYYRGFDSSEYDAGE